MRLNKFILLMSIIIFLVLTLALLAAPARGADDEAAGKAKVQDLIGNLGDPDGEIRRRAAEGLGRIGPEAKEAIPALIKVLGNDDVGRSASVALGRIARGAMEVVPALTRALSDPDVFVRCYAAETLGEIGPGAKEAVHALERLAEKDPAVRPFAREALEKIRK